MTGPGKICLLDFETRSRADLPKLGGRRYCAHESTEALCAVLWRVDAPGFEVWLPGDQPPDLEGYTLVAHNALMFDRFVAAREWGSEFANPKRWIDSAELAKRLGLPGRLAALGAKDKEGSDLTKQISHKRAWKRYDAIGVVDNVRPPEIPADVWKRMPSADRWQATYERVVEYCIDDVRVLVEAWPYLAQAIDVDADVSAAAVAINDRGVRFDAALACLLLERDAELCEMTISREAEVLGVAPAELKTIANSPAQFVAATGAPNAQAETVREIAAEGSRRSCYARARQALASIARGKLRAGLLRSCGDGRLRDTHLYYGGHTGRFSGQGMQLQNMTRPHKDFEDWGDVEFDALITELLDRPAEGREIDLLLRATICAEPGHALVAVDWSGIEARVLAWLAHDLEELDNTRNGRDPYKVAAASIYGVTYDDVTKDQRQVGKVAVLACGYGGGKDAIAKFADGMGIDLAAAGVSADEVVSGWRRAHGPTVRYWYALEAAFRRAINGEECEVGDVRFLPAPDESGVAIVLPSGRPIVYRNVRLRGEPRGYRGEREIVYQAREKNTVPDDNGVLGARIYGGLLAENITQAACRCILARALVACHNEGIPVVMHVHDEVVSEVPAEIGQATYDRQVEIMVDLPDWLTDPLGDRGDCPLGASGWVGERYRK